MINPMKRVPKELVDLNKEIRKDAIMKENNIISEAEGFRRIEKIARKGFFSFGNKKGQIIESMFLIIVLLVAVIMFSIVIFGVQTMNKTFQDSNLDQVVKDAAENEAENLPSFIDFAIGGMFFLFLIAILIFNFSASSNFITLIVFLISIFIIGPLFVFGHNTLQAVGVAFPSVFATLPITSFVINSFYAIMAFFYILLFMGLFIKPQGEFSRTGAG